MNVQFTHKVIVPKNAEIVRNADGYFESLADASEFVFSQEEYDALRKSGGVYDSFDKTFGTIIADCEEDRIEATDIERAWNTVKLFLEKTTDTTEATALQKLEEALLVAKERRVFCELVSGIKILR